MSDEMDNTSITYKEHFVETYAKDIPQTTEYNALEHKLIAYQKDIIQEKESEIDELKK